MTKILILLISTFGLNGTVTADTIDYWHVYLNNVRIQEFNHYSNAEIVLKIEDIKETDALLINYFRDTPCFDCKTEVAVENGKHFVITKANGLGTFNPIKLSLYDLLQYDPKAENDVYEVYYHGGEISSRTQRVLIFRIKLE